MTPEEFEARVKRLSELPGKVRVHTLIEPPKVKGKPKKAKPKPKLPLTEAHLLELQAQKAGFVATLEYRFHPTRKWRIDVAFVEQKLAVEIEGGIWTQGRHTRGSGFAKDMSKYNALTISGWRLLRFTPRQVRKGEAIAALKAIL